MAVAGEFFPPTLTLPLRGGGCLSEDLEKATEYLAKAGVVRRDEIENLPEGFQEVGITNPGGIIHLIS